MASTNNDAAPDAGLSAEDAKTDVPANIAPAATFSTSGAPVQLVPDVDPSHPAVDNDPRQGTTVKQNKIDFNDPTISGADAVAQKLGFKTEAEAADQQAAVAAKAAKTAA